MAVPEAMNGKFREGIRLNQQNLITAYNVYHLLMHVAIGESYPSRKLGLLADLSFQVDCAAAKVPLNEEETCNCN
jgi:hypothetical protein